MTAAISIDELRALQLERLIVDFEPRIIIVTPSYFLALDEMERTGVDPASTSLAPGTLERSQGKAKRTADRR